MDRKVVAILLLIAVAFMFGLSVAFAEEEGGISADYGEGFVYRSPRDSVDWSNIDHIVKSPQPQKGERERLGEKAGLCGAIITHGGKGRNEALVVHTPSGVPVAVVTKAQAKKNPEIAKKTIRSACGGTTGEPMVKSLNDIARFIGNLLHPSEDYNKDGKIDDVDSRVFWHIINGVPLEIALRLSSETTPTLEPKTGSGIEPMVDHVQPVVLLCGTATPPQPEETMEEIKKKMAKTPSPETASSGIADEPDKPMIESMSGISRWIGEILSPQDYNKDGKIDDSDSLAVYGVIISEEHLPMQYVSKAFPSTETASGIESMVDHVQPVVLLCGTATPPQPTETKTATNLCDDFYHMKIKINIPAEVISALENIESSWPEFMPMGDLDGDGKPDPIYSLPEDFKLFIDPHLVDTYGFHFDYARDKFAIQMDYGVSLEIGGEEETGLISSTFGGFSYSAYTPKQVFILQQMTTPVQVDHLADSLVDNLISGDPRDELYRSIAEEFGLYAAEPVTVEEVQDVIPNDPLYLQGGGRKSVKKKGGFGLGLGKSAGGSISVGGKGVSIGSGRKSKDKVNVKDQWALRRIGFKPRENHDSAWNIEDGSRKNAIVAVIDSGLDMTHPDGPQYIWRNPGEIPDNGIDDDHNGYVDDIHGWNFLENNNDLTDKKGHGTFISGIIAAKTNNGIGIAGINPGAQIMVLKVVDEKGFSNSFNTYRALRYAASKGARVINISLAGEGVSILEQLGVNYAYYKGALIVVAAGNQADIISNYGPAAFRRVLPVAAMNVEGTWSVISNKGQNMGLIAPGEDIYSLHSKDAKWLGPSAKRERLYYKQSGTSFSAPLVTATASLILAKNPNLTNRQIEDILLDTAKDLREPGWDDRTGAGLLDAYKALTHDPQGILTLRPTELIINKERKKVTSVDLFGIIRGNLESYVVELGKGKKPKKWEQVAGPQRRRVEYGFIARIDGKKVSRGKEWVVRIKATDREGNTKVAHLPLSLKEK